LHRTVQPALFLRGDVISTIAMKINLFLHYI